MKKSLFTRLLSLALTVLMIASTLSLGISAATSADWQKDSRYHWHIAADGATVIDKAEHVAAAVWSSDGKTHWRACTECGYKLNEVKCSEGTDGKCTICLNAVAEHSISNVWKTEEGSATHWKVCSKCGIKVNETAHVEGANGRCKDCGLYIHTHAQQGEWKKDSTGHWKTCVCGKIVDVNGAVITSKDAHVDAAGDGQCDVCSYHSTHVAAGGWTQTEKEHYKLCACGTVLNRGYHSDGSDADKLCDACGYNMAPPAHVCTPNVNTWKYTNEVHYRVCSCGETEFYRAAHTMENGKCTICGYRGGYVTPILPGCSHACCVGYPHCVYNHTCNNYNCTVCSKAYNVIYASATAGGVISPEGYSVVRYGNSLTYKFTPMVGYVVSKVIVDGVNIGRTSVYTFNKVTTNHTIQVVFEKVACTVHPNCSNYPYCSSVPGCKLHDCCIGYSYCIYDTACKLHDCCKGYPYCIYQPSWEYRPGCSAHPGCAGYSHCVYYCRSYSISVSGTAGGKLSPAGNAVVVAGNSMTYKFTPNDGYVISKVIVDGKDVGRVSSYTFSKVNANHTLKVVFEKMKMPFLDVYSTDWYYDDVMYVYNNDIMQGTSYTTFAPKGDITRAMIVTMLWRLEGSPASLGTQFKDVKANSYYADAVRWAAKNGIVCGDDVGTFRPDDNINREELAAILYRYAEFKGEGFVGTWAYKLGYEDVANVSDWALEAVSYLSMKNIIVTDSSVKLNPKTTASRAEAAVVLHRLCEFLNK